MKHKFLFITFLAVFLVGALHLIASAFYYYWTIIWFDNLMHFLGGFSIGLLSLWIYFSIFKNSDLTRKQTIIKSLIFVIAIGIGWEIFEYINGITQSEESYSLDTTQDLIADIIGAILAGDLVSRKKLYLNV